MDDINAKTKYDIAREKIDAALQEADAMLVGIPLITQDGRTVAVVQLQAKRKDTGIVGLNGEELKA